MASITITIPDAIAPRVLSGFCKRYNYLPTLTDGSPNPETKAQFAKRKIIDFIKLAVRESEIQDASDAASRTAGISADNDIVLG